MTNPDRTGYAAQVIDEPEDHPKNLGDMDDSAVGKDVPNPHERDYQEPTHDADDDEIEPEEDPEDGPLDNDRDG